MEKILILGAGGLGLEVADLIKTTGKYEISGFLDDDPEKTNTMVNQIPVLGSIDQLNQFHDTPNLAIAIANPAAKMKTARRALDNGFIFPNIIHPSAIIESNCSLGRGNILCAGSILSTEACLHDFVTINPQCGIGHESEIKSFTTLYWGVHIGGKTVVDEGCELGTHSCVLQGLHIVGNVIIGSGAVVVKDINIQGTYLGVPAKRLTSVP